MFPTVEGRYGIAACLRCTQLTVRFLRPKEKLHLASHVSILPQQSLAPIIPADVAQKLDKIPVWEPNGHGKPIVH